MALKATVTATCDKCAYTAKLLVEDTNLSHPSDGRATLELEVQFENAVGGTGRAMLWQHYYDKEANDFVDVCPYCLARTADSGC